MTSHATLKSTVLAIALLLAGGAHAANLSKDAYKQAKAGASATYKTEKNACDAMKDNAKDICVQEAKGHERVAKAQAEYDYTGKPKDMTKLNKVKAEATYDVAKERCDDKAGNDKDVCVKEAKAMRDKAVADVTARKEIGEAKMDATKTKRDADYKVAAEKCDALAGDAKSACMTSAKTKYGKL